jgi:hypothetical protein
MKFLNPFTYLVNEVKNNRKDLNINIMKNGKEIIIEGLPNNLNDIQYDLFTIGQHYNDEKYTNENLHSFNVRYGNTIYVTRQDVDEHFKNPISYGNGVGGNQKKRKTNKRKKTKTNKRRKTKSKTNKRKNRTRRRR